MERVFSSNETDAIGKHCNIMLFVMLCELNKAGTNVHVNEIQGCDHLK